MGTSLVAQWWKPRTPSARGLGLIRELDPTWTGSSHAPAEDSAFVVPHSLSYVQLFVTPWTAAHQASLSITNSQSLLKLMSIELVMSFNHLVLFCPLLLVGSSDKMWSPGEGNGKPLQHSCLENPKSSMKRLCMSQLKDSTRHNEDRGSCVLQLGPGTAKQIYTHT